MDVRSIRPSAGVHDSPNPALASTFTRFYDNPKNNILDNAVSSLQNIGKADSDNLLYFDDKGEIKTEQKSTATPFTKTTQERDIRNLPFFFDKLKSALINCDSHKQMIDVYQAFSEAAKGFESLKDHYKKNSTPEEFKKFETAINDSLRTIDSLGPMMESIKKNRRERIAEEIQVVGKQLIVNLNSAKKEIHSIVNQIIVNQIEVINKNSNLALDNKMDSLIALRSQLREAKAGQQKAIADINFFKMKMEGLNS